MMVSVVKRRTQTPSTQVLRRVENPVHMSEDEADLIIANRRAKEPTIDFQDYLRKHGCEIKKTPGQFEI